MLTDLPENKDVAAGDLLEPSRVTAWRGEARPCSIRQRKEMGPPCSQQRVLRAGSERHYAPGNCSTAGFHIFC